LPEVAAFKHHAGTPYTGPPTLPHPSALDFDLTNESPFNGISHTATKNEKLRLWQTGPIKRSKLARLKLRPLATTENSRPLASAARGRSGN